MKLFYDEFANEFRCDDCFILLYFGMKKYLGSEKDGDIDAAWTQLEFACKSRRKLFQQKNKFRNYQQVRGSVR
jgi:hypothetical protein